MQRSILTFFALAGILIHAICQPSLEDTAPNKHLELGKELAEKGLHASAIHEFESYLELSATATPQQYKKDWLEANYLKAMCELIVHPEKGKRSLEKFIYEFSPGPEVEDAKFGLGSYFYNTRQYNEANKRFSSLDPKLLNDSKQLDFHFKYGYCLFVKKSFAEAEDQFLEIKDYRHQAYYNAQYYLGMCYYFKGDYTEAAKSFEIASSSEKYNALVPYYLSQIYFSLGQFDLLIVYAEQHLESEKVQKKNELHQLLGQSYYEQGDFGKALEHLEIYEKNTSKLTEEQFYHLAFAQYKSNQFSKAIDNFRELATLNSELGQNSNYYLADCYLKTNEKNAARVCFRTASQMSFLPNIRDEARFNYGKLSAELQFNSDALTALSRIEKNSKHYYEAQAILSQLFLESKNYLKTIEILRDLPELTPELQKAYQQVHYAQGVLLYNDRKKKEAIPYFQESLNTPSDKSLVAQALFWIADLRNQFGDFQGSIDDFENYFFTLEVAENVAEECAASRAYYIQGYNYLHLNDYATAASNFENSYRLISSTTSTTPGDKNELIYSDALVRAADCFFKMSAYEKAQNTYQSTASRNLPKSDYALFQTAILQGLREQPFEKILTLEELIERYPSSDYTESGLMILGDAYFALDNQQKARESYSKIVFMQGINSDLKNQGLLKLGLISYNSGDLPGALNHYKQVFKNNPSGSDSQQALMAIEEIYVEDLAQSREYIEFLETIPGYKLDEFKRDSISFATARIQFENKNYPAAVQAFTDYLTRYPKGYYFVEAYYLNAESKNLLEEFSVALEDYEYLVKIGNSKHFQSALWKAAVISFNNEENFEKSLLYFGKFYDVASDTEQKYQAALGALRSAYRNHDLDALLRYSVYIIDHQSATNEELAFAQYCRGKTFYSNENLSEAKNSFQKSVELSNNVYSVESNYLIGEILFRDGSMDLAESHAQKAYQESTNYPYWVGKNLLLLSDVYLFKKDLLSARAALEAIIDNYTTVDDMLMEARTNLALVKKLQEEQNRLEDPAAQDTIVLEKGNNNE